MKRNHHRAERKTSRHSAAAQSQRVHLVLHRRTIPSGCVRLQFIEVGTGRTFFSFAVRCAFLRIIERAAKDAGVILGQFIVAAIESQLGNPEFAEQRRAAA